MTYCHISLLFLLLPTFLEFSRSATASPLESQTEVLLEDRLRKIESNQNLLRTRIPQWESYFDQILKKLEQLENRLSHQSGCNNAQSPVDPLKTSILTAATPMAYDSIASKIDTLSLDTQASVDELHEKVLRLEERLGHHERTSNQQLERLLSVAGSGLEMAASFRTESAMESRRHLRSLESKLASLSTSLENRFQHLLWVQHSLNHTHITTNISNSGGNQKSAKVNNPTQKNLKRNIFTQTDIDGQLGAIVDTYKQRLKSTPTKSLRSPARKQFFNETVVMDQSVSGSHVRDQSCNCTCASSISEESWKQFIQQQSSTLTHKLGNMYDELWRQGKLMVDQLQLVAQTVNESKWHMDEGFRMLFSGYPSAPSVPFVPLPTSQTIEMTLKDLDKFIRQRMDLFEEKIESQVSEIVSCSSDWDSSQLVAEALEKLVYLTSNRTQSLNEEMAELQHRMDRYHEQQLDLLMKISGNLQKEVLNEVNEIAADSKPVKIIETTDEEEEKPPEANDYSYVDPQEVDEDRNL